MHQNLSTGSPITGVAIATAVYDPITNHSWMVTSVTGDLTATIDRGAHAPGAAADDLRRLLTDAGRPVGTILLGEDELVGIWLIAYAPTNRPERPTPPTAITTALLGIAQLAQDLPQLADIRLWPWGLEISICQGDEDGARAWSAALGLPDPVAGNDGKPILCGAGVIWVLKTQGHALGTEVEIRVTIPRDSA